MAQFCLLSVIFLIYSTKSPSATAFFTYHVGDHHRQSTHRFHAVNTEVVNKQNHTVIINSRPLQDITTANLYNLYKTEFKSTTSLSSSVQQYIQVVGYIVKYRSYGSSLAFLDVIQSDLKNETAEILIKRDSYHLASSTCISTEKGELGQSPLSALMKSLRPGMKIQMIGVPSTTHNPGEVVFLAQNIKFLRLSRDPQQVKGILQHVQVDEKGRVPNNGKEEEEDDKTGLDIDEIANCISVSSEALQRVLLGKTKSLNKDTESENHTDNTINASMKNSNIEKWNRSRILYASIASEICARLEPDDEYPEIFLKKLHSKKSKKGSIQVLDNNDAMSQIHSQHYRGTFPMAPLEYVHTSSNILSHIHRVETGEESMDETCTTVSIQELLESSTEDNGIDTITQLVATSGWVLNRKQYRDSICILWVTADSFLNPEDVEANQSIRIKCVLDRKILERSYATRHGATSDTSSTYSPFDVYSYISSAGTGLDIRGYHVHNFADEKTPVLWITDIHLRRSTWSPQTINFLLTLLSRTSSFDGSILDDALYPLSIEEITSAFDLPGGESEAKQLIQFCCENDTTARQWRAAEISKRLQELNTRTKSMTAEMIQILDSFESVRELWPIEHVALTNGNDEASSSYTKRSSSGSRWERVKRPQLEWMTREVLNLAQTHPDFGTRPLNIMDIGGGRGHLANYISSALGNSTAIMHVIDIDSRAVKNGMMRSKRNMLKVQYAVGDASDSAFLAEQWGSHRYDVDIVVALHACGTLSDVALAFALSHSASFIIVPCCFRSNSHLSVNIQQGDSQIQSFSPYKWLGISSEQLKLLNLIAESQGGHAVHASKGVHTICSLRANAVKQYQRAFSIRLKTFPVAFSTRNFCIVGSPPRAEP